MKQYHSMFVHLSLALWSFSALIIIFRAFSDSQMAKSLARVLLFVLTAALVTASGTLLTGYSVWPWEAVSTTPLGRNHMLFAAWCTVFWAAVLFIRLRAGEALWEGALRFVMAGLAFIGCGLFAVTATLGGGLGGLKTTLSKMLRAFGWEVYTTYYLPNFALGLLVVIALLLAGLGFIRKKRLA